MADKVAEHKYISINSLLDTWSYNMISRTRGCRIYSSLIQFYTLTLFCIKHVHYRINTIDQFDKFIFRGYLHTYILNTDMNFSTKYTFKLYIYNIHIQYAYIYQHIVEDDFTRFHDSSSRCVLSYRTDNVTVFHELFCFLLRAPDWLILTQQSRVPCSAWSYI